MGSVHEHNPSLWVETTEIGNFPPLARDVGADVVVVGAGITGLMTARLLLEQGASVIVLDAGDLCAGATGYTTAKITSLHGLTYRDLADRFDEQHARLYGEANQAAIEEIARVVALDGIDCDFERRRHSIYTTDPDRVDEIQAEADLVARLGLPVVPTPSVSDNAALGLPFDVTASLTFENQAQFHPRAMCLGLAQSIRDQGGRIYSHTRVRDIDGDQRTAYTDQGEARGEHVVVATHLPINQMGAYFARTEPHRSYALAITTDGDHPHDMFISVDSPTRSLRTAGDHLIVGGEGHQVGAKHDTSEHYRNLEAWAREHFNVRSVDHRWSAQDWVAADRVPYIGRMAGYDEGIYVATAFAKWGMTHGAIAALIFSDLIAGRDHPWLEVYDSTRIAPKQSLPGVISENVTVIQRFFGDRIEARSESDEELRGLAPGEGTVVYIDGDPVAASRDDDGTLRTVSARCTHMGCLVAYNAAERSWDCPCHGSRFAADGRLLEGPAVDDLPAAAPPTN